MSIRKYHICLLFALTLLSQKLCSQTQVYGNEWIVPGQTYYKIPTAQTGIYALSAAELEAIGGTGNVSNLQLFHRGIEQQVLVKDNNNDGIFDSGDTLLFYGQINDGTLDSILYSPPSAQPHKYYNMYSDTTAYFLTFGTTVGKRMQQENTPVGGGVIPYHLSENLLLFTSNYYKGNDYGVNGGDTYFATGDYGEGWFGGGIPPGIDANNLPVTNVYTNSGIQPVVELMLVGLSGSVGNIITHEAEVIIGNTVYTVKPFHNDSVRVFTQTIDADTLISYGNSLPVNIQQSGFYIIAKGYIKLTYPQGTDMQGQNSKYFNILSNGQNTSYLKIANASSNSTIYDISDVNNINLVPFTVIGDTLNAYVNSSSNLRLLVNANNNYLTIPSIKKVDLTDYPLSQYLIVSHSSLINPPSTGVTEYALYRSTVAGGNYKTVVADINKLYDLYSYGEPTPVAIKRFVSYQYAKGNAEYLFIIGKGLSPGFQLNSSVPFYRQDPDYYRQNFNPFENIFINLVPPYGYPGSDLLFSMGIDPSNTNVPALATGRLSATSDSVVTNYLAKVQEHEALDSNLLWRKNLIHVSGGSDDGGSDQIAQFAQYLQNLVPIAEDTLFGGKVIASLVKQSSSTVDEQLRSSVIELLNTQGASYLTFFGHSAPTLTDVDLGWPSEAIYGYNNKNLYPFMVLFSCSAGDCFDGYSFVEDFLNTAEKGAIGAMAHSGEGYEIYLDSYAQTFYDVAFQNGQTMLKSIGQIQREVLANFYKNYVNNAITTANAQEMIIQGDPALRIYTPSKPDYSIINSQAEQVFLKSYNGQPVTAISDSFAIGIVVSNFGLVTVRDSFDVTITRTYNNTTVTYGPILYPPVYYQDTIYFKIKSSDRATYGENSFTIKVNPSEKVREITYDNNTAVLSSFIPLSGVITLSPPDYSIVNSSMLNADKSITLVAQSTDLTIEPTDYIIEIDTSYLFTSSYKKSAVVDAPALLKWNTTLLPSLQDSVVYYWRARFNAVPAGEDTIWAQSSFIYISKSPPGWSQSQFPQFLQDNPNNILMGSLSQKNWQFDVVNTEITVRAVGANYPEPSGSIVPASEWQSWMGTLIEVDNTPLYYGTEGYYIQGGYQGCTGYSQGNAPLNVMAFSKKTALPYVPNFSQSSNVCGIYSPLFINVLYDPNGSTQLEQNIIDYVNSVEEGDYILFLTTWQTNFQTWSSNLKNTLQTHLGLTLLDSLQNGDPYLFLARKNDGKPIFEGYANPQSSVYLDTIIIGRQDTGNITSTVIGPATSWGTVYRTVKDVDSSDHYTLQVIGINQAGKDSLLVKNVSSDTFNISNINATQFPYLELNIIESDTVSLTPPQLKEWQVIFSQAPEGTLDLYKAGLQQYQYFTKQEGDSVKLSFIFENISAYNFPDSLKVEFIVTNESGKTSKKYITLPPLKSDTSVTFSYTFNTYGFSGNNTLEAYVNPKLQPEQDYDNNIANITFFVVADKTAPVLDVVFDGVHIMDGDIVSPSPLIAISLTDNNPYLIKNDTTGMTLFLQSPGQATPQPISLSNNSSIKYGQSAGNSNNFVVDYSPQNLRDGVYTLIVQGADVSGNNSGSLQYQIQFQVINESTVTNFYPYPNPFSTQTRFVFTLTGSDIPEDIIIEIMNVTGTVVRELTKNDLGTIKIGNNMTNAWNGTDEYGDRLANGLYLYKVKLKGNSNDFAHRNTAGDQDFKKGFGKLYILR